jgi:hypothetical protein
MAQAAPGPFPPLKNVKEVREFDGSSEALSDFSISVDSIIAAYNLPVQQGGYVRGNMDDGWTYIKPADHQLNPAASRLNLPYGARFCTLLAERLTGNAREWWIARRESQTSPPNCWIRPSERDFRDVNNPMISFKELLENQFGNPLEQEMAMHQLDALTWDRDTESLNMFKTRASSLFLKARINSWLMQRGYILKAFSNSMRERILQPASADELWKLAYNIVITDDSIKATKPMPKEAKRTEKDKTDKKGKDLKDIECFNCHEKGHYAPQCPNKEKSEKSSRRRRKDKSDDKEDRKDDDVCFKCGGRGHRSTECPSSRTYKEGDEAKRKRSTSPPQKKSAAKLHYDTRPVDTAPPQLGQDWRPFHHIDIKPLPPPTSKPFYAFEARPQRAKLFDPPVDSDVIWDGTQFVNASAYYYYNDD